MWPRTFVTVPVYGTTTGKILGPLSTPRAAASVPYTIQISLILDVALIAADCWVGEGVN